MRHNAEDSNADEQQASSAQASCRRGLASGRSCQVPSHRQSTEGDFEHDAVQETAPGGAESSLDLVDTSTHEFLDDFPKEDFILPTNDPEGIAAYEEANELSQSFFGPDDDFWKTGVPTVARSVRVFRPPTRADSAPVRSMT